MSNKIKKIEPEMEYPDYIGKESLQNLKDNPFSGFQTHDLSFVMAMVIRKINELVDAVNAPVDKAIISEDPDKSILQEAGEVINGDRAIDYGDMKTSFENIAKGWSVIAGSEITDHQVGLMMIWLKTCRENNKHKRDNLVDLAGYAACLENITCKSKKQ